MWLLLLAPAFAQRPTAGGLWSYEDSDVLEQYDSDQGLVRVTYSVSGPNECADRDSTGTGVPDIVEITAQVAEDALLRFEKQDGVDQ